MHPGQAAPRRRGRQLHIQTGEEDTSDRSTGDEATGSHSAQELASSPPAASSVLRVSGVLQLHSPNTPVPTGPGVSPLTLVSPTSPVEEPRHVNRDAGRTAPPALSEVSSFKADLATLTPPPASLLPVSRLQAEAVGSVPTTPGNGASRAGAGQRRGGGGRSSRSEYSMLAPEEHEQYIRDWGAGAHSPDRWALNAYLPLSKIVRDVFQVLVGANEVGGREEGVAVDLQHYLNSCNCKSTNIAGNPDLH